MSDAPIPLVDLRAQHRAIEKEVAVGWEKVLDRTAFILGEEVGKFEAEFASFSGVKHCIGVANGTDALELALRASGIGMGDEVIVPTNSFVASALAVMRAGARPVLVDVTHDYLLDSDDVARKMTPQTRAIMPVHLYGQMAPMEDLATIASDQVLIIEDAAQAQGAVRNGVGAGAFGISAGTSFYPGKNLGAYGDAGAVITNSDDVAAKVRALRNYGSEVKYLHPQEGYNSRLDTLQAVVLSAKLRRLADGNAARRVAAAKYEELLEDLDEVTLPSVVGGNEHIWHLYVVRVPDRDRVLEKLHEQDIGAGIHYPVPIHLQGAFKSLGHEEGDFPVAEEAASQILSLPLFPEILPEQQQRVADALRKAVR